MRVLLLVDSVDWYTVQLYNEMKRRYQDLSVSILTCMDAGPFYEGQLDMDENEAVYVFEKKGRIQKCFSLRNTVRTIPQFDIVHSLWMKYQWGVCVADIKKKCRHWVSSVGGSDLFVDSKKTILKMAMKRIVNHADWLTAETPETERFFFQVFGERFRRKPHSVNPFGIDVLEELDCIENGDIETLKNKWNISQDKIIITCGHNAGRRHNHLAMIRAFRSINKEVLDRLFFVFPMTYPDGQDEYIAEVEKEIRGITDHYLILRKYMSPHEMAEMAHVSDVMIHVQDTDQLSSTMVSHMYDGNIVIAGDWLPYKPLREMGIHFLDVHEIEDLAGCLEYLVSELEAEKKKCECNRELVWNMSSWDAAAKKWYHVYESLMKGETENGHSI